MAVHILVVCILLCPTVFVLADTIRCGIDDGCFNNTITCVDNESCSIECIGRHSCLFSTILCPTSKSASCALHCEDTKSCNSVIIHAESSSQLNVTVAGKHALSYSDIYCPWSMGDDTCHIEYNGNTSALNNIRFYTPYNYDSISIYCSSPHYCWSNGDNPQVIYHYNKKHDHEVSCVVYDVDTCIAQRASNSSDSGQEVFLILLGILCGMFISICCCSLCIKWINNMNANPGSASNVHLLTKPILEFEPINPQSALAHEYHHQTNPTLSQHEGMVMRSNSDISDISHDNNETPNVVLEPGEFVIDDDDCDGNDTQY